MPSSLQQARGGLQGLLFLCGFVQLLLIYRVDCTITVDDFIPAQSGQDVTAVWNYVQPQGSTMVLAVDWYFGSQSESVASLVPPSTSPTLGPSYTPDKVEVHFTDSQARLTIKNFDTSSDEGRYRCDITFLVGSVLKVEQAATVLAVPAPPSPASPSISGYTEDTFVASGSPLTLTCTSRQGKPPADLTWYKGTTPQSAAYSSSPNDMGQGDATSVLNIAALQQADNGAVYQCRASQTALAQDQSTQVTVSVAFFEDTTTSITGFPSTAVDAGTPLTLTCTSGNSNPAASITWSQDGTTVTGINNQQQAGSNGGKVTTQDLVISLQPEHNGARYTCRATNSELGLDRDSSTVGPLNVRFFQSGTAISGNSPVTAGTPLTLTCTSGNSNPAASITWTRGGTDVTGTNTEEQAGANSGKITTQQLVLSNLQPGDNGMEVRCAAVNSGLSQTQEDTVIVVVNYGPRNVSVTCDPSDLSDLREGGDLECTCTAESNPAAQYSWTYGTAGSTPTGSLPTGAVVDQTAGTLTFDTLDKEHTGDYRCTATNSISSAASDSITVDVKYAPAEPTIVANATAIEEGDSVQLTCQTTSNPPASYDWTRQSGELPDDARVETSDQTSVLVIPGLIKHDSGTYICAASNVVLPGGITKEHVLTVLYLHQPVLSSNDVSIIAGPPRQATVRENTSVAFTCTADANPTADIMWTGPHGELTNEGQLQLSSVERTQAGNYTCNASNNIKGEPRSKDVTLEIIVNYPPSITFITPAVTVDEFDDVSLTCTADSNPEPTEDSFSWTNMTDASLPGDLTNQGFTLTTTISNITYLEAGTYTCTAYNGIGAAASAVTNVTVEYAPKFSHPPDPYPAAIGDDVSMECSAFAVPNKITFTWSKNGTVLTNSSRLTIQSSGEISVLSISGVEEGDYGTYNCAAENGEGSSNTTRILQPQGPPSKPTGLRVVSKNEEFVVWITWTAGFNGGLDTTHTVQLTEAGADQWEDVAREEQAFSQQHRTFDVSLNLKAQEAGDYQIRIEARNSKGRNMSDPVDLKLEGNQRLYGTITRNIDWVEALKDKQSDEFREKAALWERNLDNFFNPRFVGYEGATITQFSQGSIVGTFEAVVAQSETQDAIKAFNTQVNAGSVGDLTVVKESSMISDTQPVDPPSSFPLVPVVAVVCAVLLVAIIGVGVFVVRRRKSANEKKDVELRERITRDDRPSLNGLSNPGLDTENSPDPAYAEVPSNGAVPMAGGNPYDDVHFEGDGTTAPVAGATAGPLDPNVQYATVNKNNNETPNPSTIYAQVDKDKKKKDKEKPTLVVDPSSEYATVDKSKKKKKDMPPPPEDPSAQYSEVKKDKKKGKKDMPPTPEDPSAQYSEVKKDKKKGKKDMPPTPEDPSAQYSEVKKDKKKDKKAPAPDVIYTEVVKDKKDKKEKKDKKKPTPGKKPAVAKKPTAKDEERLYDEVPKAEGAAAVTDENPYENPQESMPEKQKNPQGLIYAELSDFQVKPPPKKPSKPAPPKPRYEDEPTEYASINWNASRRRAKEREQSGSTTDDETPVTMI